MGEFKFKRLCDDDWIDAINFVTVPRFKESGLSGDEWRTSVVIYFYRKGLELGSASFRDMEAASCWLVWALCCKEDDRIEWFNKNDLMYCDQPGCSDYADKLYKIKTHYTDRGELSTYQPKDEHRKFCLKHKERGNSDMEDCDSNYEFIGDLVMKSKRRKRTMRLI